MITANNYYNQINSIGANQLPPTLLKSHELVNKVTQEGASWETYNGNSTIKRMIDLYFTKLNEYAEQHKPKRTVKNEAPKREVKTTQPKSNIAPPKKTVTAKKVDTANQVEHIEDELKFIKRFTLLNGKTKTAEQVLGFLNSVQKAIIEKRIRKTSPYANEIKIIQEKLVQVYNAMGTSIQIHLKPETMEKMIKLVKSEKVMPSIKFIKRYVSLQGKVGVKDKAKKLLDDMQKAVKQGVLTKADKYSDKVNAMYLNLHNLITKPKQHDALDISKYELNGLMGILNSCGCGCNGLDGVEDDDEQSRPANQIMNSVDFAKLQFDSIGFKGKWLDFIGDPSQGFTAMVFGKPKMGKSYLCIDFAGYLSRNHGKVLYVAKEEKLDATLQKKLNDTNVKNPNLFVSDYLPGNLSEFDYVFLDSVNKMELQPNDLESLKTNFPNVSFIYVFQTTKEGNFRGSNHFQHDVDVVIEIPEKGRATQNGRFNQGGEMQIFDEDGSTPVNELNGVSRKKKNASRFPDWTEPKDLNASDWRSLKIIKKYYDEGDYQSAMNHAMYNSDTEIREAIPPNVWLEIGGQLTPTGRERLRVLLETYPEK
jgi:hypothetical protein